VRHTAERPENLVRISIIAFSHGLDRMKQTAPRAARSRETQQILLGHWKRDTAQILRYEMAGVVVDGHAGGFGPLVKGVRGVRRGERFVNVFDHGMQDALVPRADPRADQGGEQTNHQRCEQRASGGGSR
jgi:hypothetical protein